MEIPTPRAREGTADPGREMLPLPPGRSGYRSAAAPTARPSVRTACASCAVAVDRALLRSAASDRRFNHDGPSHVWMQGAEILISTGRREREGESVLCIEGLRLKKLGGRRDGMRNVVVVDPSDRCAGFRGDLF